MIATLKIVLVVTVFGWPAAIAALALAVWGIRRQRPALVVVGAAVGLPFAYYVSGSPALGALALLPVAGLAAAAIAVRRGRRRLAYGLTVPFAAVVAWLAWAVLTR